VHTFVAIFSISWVLLILGIAIFIYYLCTGKRWAWGLAVAFMTVGLLGITMWW